MGLIKSSLALKSDKYGCMALPIDPLGSRLVAMRYNERSFNLDEL